MMLKPILRLITLLAVWQLVPAHAQTDAPLGEAEWEGKSGMALLLGSDHAYYDKERRIIATARDGKPIQTYHPYEALAYG